MEYKLTQEEFRQFLADQLKEMEKHKWIESEKAHKDLGDVVILEWIEMYAESYRNHWISIKLKKTKNGQ